MHHSFSSTASQLRMKNQTTMVSAIAMMVFALFVSALLPTLLVRYVYAGQQLFEQPALLEYLPIAAFVLGAGYFVYAVIINMLREKRAMYLDMMMEDECNCNHDHDDMMAEVARAAEAAAPKATTKRKTASKAKKTTRKSTTSKK